MKQVTMESVKQRIADLERARFGGLAISLQEERELACLHQLVAVTEQRDALLVENVGLKRIPKNDSVAMLLALDSFRSESLPDVGLQKAFETLMYHRETPAADAEIAVLRAEGVEMFAAQERAIAARRKSNGMDDCFIKKILETAENAEEFAKELRESKGAQS